MGDKNENMPLLFTSKSLRNVTLKNRIVISPMCQYSARDGLANEWHTVHLGQFALGGASLIFCEAAAVEARGRITHGDLGIWTADHAAALRPVVEFIKAHGAIAGIQLAHAGRKASMQRPWYGNGPLDETDEARGELNWKITAPSPEPVNKGALIPEELNVESIHAIQKSFADAAGYASVAGFEVLEIHSAHGYLSHSFLSPISNHRNDSYGGDLACRMRFSLEIVEKVRAVWPDDKPLFVRISSIDGAEGGWELEHSIALIEEMKNRGVDVVDCSSGGISGPVTAAHDPLPLGFRVPLSENIRQKNKIATMTHGLILYAEQAEEILKNNQADLIGIAREALFDPYWPRHAAHALGVDPNFDDWPKQYGWWLTRREKTLQALGER